MQIGTLFAGSLTLGLVGVGHSLALSAAMSLLTGLVCGVCGVCGGLSNALIQTAPRPATSAGSPR